MAESTKKHGRIDYIIFDEYGCLIDKDDLEIDKFKKRLNKLIKEKM